MQREYTLTVYVNSVGNIIKVEILKNPSFVMQIARLNRLDIGGSWKEKVYDLTIEGEHEFFANGILVHNCMDAIRYAFDKYRRQNEYYVVPKDDMGNRDWSIS